MHLHTIVVGRWRVPPVLTPWHHMADVAVEAAPVPAPLIFCFVASSLASIFSIPFHLPACLVLCSPCFWIISCLRSFFLPTFPHLCLLSFFPTFPAFPTRTPTLRSPNIIRDMALHTSGSIGVVPHVGETVTPLLCGVEKQLRKLVDMVGPMENTANTKRPDLWESFRMVMKKRACFKLPASYKWIWILSYCEGVIYKCGIHDLQWWLPDVVTNPPQKKRQRLLRRFIEMFGVSRCLIHIWYHFGPIKSDSHRLTLAESSNHCSPNKSGPCHLALRHFTMTMFWRWDLFHLQLQSCNSGKPLPLCSNKTEIWVVHAMARGEQNFFCTVITLGQFYQG